MPILAIVNDGTNDSTYEVQEALPPQRMTLKTVNWLYVPADPANHLDINHINHNDYTTAIPFASRIQQVEVKLNFLDRYDVNSSPNLSGGIPVPIHNEKSPRLPTLYGEDLPITSPNSS